QAREAEDRARAEWRDAQRAIAAAQAGLDAAQKDLARLTARQAALAETAARVAESLLEAEADLARARSGAAEIASEGDALAMAEDRQRAVTAAREDFQQAAGRLAGFESAAKMRENRLSRIAQELESWTRRGESARAQLDILKGRQQDIEAQLAALAAT